LHTITLESLGAPIVHVHRESDGDRAFRVHESVAIVAIDVQVVGDDLELIAGHLKYVVVINIHKRASDFGIPGRQMQKVFGRGSGKSSNPRFWELIGQTVRERLWQLHSE
jgi:hypothetical protein